MIHKYSLIFFVLLLALGSCEPSVKPIDFSSDTCAYCKMRIVDQRFGAELLTQKGKVYKYDALECLVNHEEEATDFKAEDIHSKWTIDFANPTNLINLEGAHYLYCEEFPSPMGMYLSTFSDPKQIDQILNEHEGEILDWAGVKNLVETAVPWE